MVALPCGHIVCTDDFARLGGHLKPEPTEDARQVRARSDPYAAHGGVVLDEDSEEGVWDGGGADSADSEFSSEGQVWFSSGSESPRAGEEEEPEVLFETAQEDVPEADDAESLVSCQEDADPTECDDAVSCREDDTESLVSCVSCLGEDDHCISDNCEEEDGTEARSDTVSCASYGEYEPELACFSDEDASTEYQPYSVEEHSEDDDLGQEESAADAEASVDFQDYESEPSPDVVWQDEESLSSLDLAEYSPHDIEEHQSDDATDDRESIRPAAERTYYGALDDTESLTDVDEEFLEGEHIEDVEACMTTENEFVRCWCTDPGC